MWLHLLVGAICASVAWPVGVWVGWAANTRLTHRLQARAALLSTIVDLENRRAGYDSGRTNLARSSAGKPARIRDGMDTVPGRFDKYLRDSAAK